MSSRNATRQDFEQVMDAIKNGAVNANNYITHRVPFEMVKTEFEKWLKPETGVIKAMVHF
jgi:threonine dehydrogenase-like Zn-dependent dehydrogenase